ncbi:MAG TPA: DUF1295 domain-containing protein [Lacunisphaera sp.]|jgi:steroid 5-alpha reductase family enzyme
MDLYAEKSKSWLQKGTITMAEFVLLLCAYWILFGEVGRTVEEWMNVSPVSPVPVRRYVIFGFSVIIFLRMTFMMFVLMHRRIPWSEAFTIPFAFALYYLGFAVLSLPSQSLLSAWDGGAIFIFLMGCYLNTASEISRHRFKRDPDNRNRLYTGGLFSLARHINFFGDILWVCAYAAITHSWWSSFIPLFTFSFFAFYNVPALDRHLAKRYGAVFEQYAARTKKLIPFVW